MEHGIWNMERQFFASYSMSYALWRMNGFTKKRVGTMTLGERIRKLRSDKRISLVEVSRATKIRIDYLSYLEEGNYNRLPADVYTKGFLRSYAEFLGADENSFIRLFEKEKGIKKNIEKVRAGRNEDLKAKPINISSFVFTPKKMVIFFTLILTLAGIVYLYREIGSFSNTPRLVVLSPENGATVKGNSVFVEGITDKDAKLFVNNQPILVNDDGKFRENVTVQPGVNVLNIKSVNKFNKEIQETVQIQADYEEKLGEGSNGSDTAEEDDGNGSSQEIQLELRVDPGPVWLSVEADDNMVFNGTMLTGAVQVFKAKEKIMVNSGKASATMVKFNGKDIGPLGQEAKAVRGVVFTKETKF